MTSINEIFRTFGPEYLQRYANSMPKTHLKVIDAMMACRTEACGLALYQCASCARSHELYRSCGNRHCPTCQHHKTQQWLEKQINRQLPTHHFLFTFTVPENLRPFMRKNQRAAYSALFKTSSEAIKKLAPDPHYLGGDLPGFFGVLHTGDEPYSTIPISITSSPVALCPQPMAAGIPPQPTSISPSKRSPKSSKPSSERNEKSAVCSIKSPLKSGTRLERRLPSRAFQPSVPQIPRPLRLQSRHLQLTYLESPRPHCPHSLPKTAQHPLKNSSPRSHGVHPALLTTRAADRLHESPLLRIYESQL